MRSCVWVRDLRVASLHFAESVFLLVAKADLILFLSFLISLMFLPPRILDWCAKQNVKQKLKNPMILNAWVSPGKARGEPEARLAPKAVSQGGTAVTAQTGGDHFTMTEL